MQYVKRPTKYSWLTMKYKLISLVQTNIAVVEQDAEGDNNIEDYHIKYCSICRNRERMNFSSTAWYANVRNMLIVSVGMCIKTGIVGEGNIIFAFEYSIYRIFKINYEYGLDVQYV